MAAPAHLPPPAMEEDGATPPAPAAPESVPPPPEPKPSLLRQRPPVRVTSEFDSERRLFSHRFSCRVLDGFAKLRLRVSHGAGGGGIAWGPPDVSLLAKNFSVIVDPASRSAVLRGSTDLAGSLRLRASHNTKCVGITLGIPERARTDILALSGEDEQKGIPGTNRLTEQQGEVSVAANLGDSPCKIELSSLVPPSGLPRATFFFPKGEVSIKEKILDEGERILSVNGLVKSHVLNGVCTAVYNDNALNIKYRYKVGDAGGSTKEVPLKAKVRFTLKVPQDNVQNSVVVFHVKKRWDF
ncbi:hypothetical protein HU200_059467 [Digitaria exilis]|uniref:Uncharacterized protein n=1 Tax=Digitaria exilis TaxID=1010633 RepID=A0A835DY61_9POAL|nr:hypothetical protein HU200_059467 [Digitaria exilis]